MLRDGLIRRRRSWFLEEMEAAMMNTKMVKRKPENMNEEIVLI
jgi:hypothetical protein